MLPKLLVSPAEAKAQIEDRFIKGNNLRPQQFIDMRAAQRSRNKIQIWANFNVTMLRGLFDSQDFLEEYMRCDFLRSFPPIPGDAWDKCFNAIEAHLTVLHSIIERLPLLSVANYLQGDSSVPFPHLTIALEEAHERLADRIGIGRMMVASTVKDDGELNRIRQQGERWSTYNQTMLEKMFDTDAILKEYLHANNRPRRLSLKPSLEELTYAAFDMISSEVNHLLSVQERLILFQPNQHRKEAMTTRSTTKVFIVHGHDDLLKTSVARLVEKLNLESVILHEQRNKGKTIIEKFEVNADVGFAIVLLTPDDMGYKASTPDRTEYRARQNVVLELGYFFGKLGRERVCALVKGDIEKPSDIDGIVYVVVDSHDAWKTEIAKEMKAAGMSVDLNHL